MSISESDDARRYGLSKEHLDTLTDEIHLYLLLAGLKIAYGGALQADFTRGSNFILRLFELVRAYSRLAEGIKSKPLENAILNVAPSPLYLGYGEGEWDLFRNKIVKYQAAPRPDLPWGDDEVFPVTEGRRNMKSDTPERRYAWARGLTAMREGITQASQARLVLGGKLTGFAGLVLGVVEEAWLSLKHRHPLFVAGGFGGAARAVADLLLGTARPEFDGEWARQTIADYDASRVLYDQHGGDFIAREQMGRDIQSLRAAGLEAALNNGLSDEENRELMLAPKWSIAGAPWVGLRMGEK